MKTILSVLAMTVALLSFAPAEAQLPRTPQIVAENIGSGSFKILPSTVYVVPADGVYRLSIQVSRDQTSTGDFCLLFLWSGVFGNDLVRLNTTNARYSVVSFSAKAGPITMAQTTEAPGCGFTGTWHFSMIVERL